MILSRIAPYAILVLLAAIALAIIQIERLEKRYKDRELEYTSAAYRAQVDYTDQLQRQADAYGNALADVTAQKERLAARNETLSKQIREVADYAYNIAESLRLRLNSMLNYPTGQDGWPTLPAAPVEPAKPDTSTYPPPAPRVD